MVAGQGPKRGEIVVIHQSFVGGFASRGRRRSAALPCRGIGLIMTVVCKPSGGEEQARWSASKESLPAAGPS
jgi:hypothetical protein